MSILDNYFNIFREGANDAAFRQKALDIGRKLTTALERIKPTDLDFPKVGSPIVSVDIGELLKDDELKDLQLWFVARNAANKITKRGAFMKKMKTGENRIELYFDVPDEVFSKVNPEVWRKLISKKASGMLDQDMEIFWHEFIHYMDLKRMSPSSQRASFAQASKIGGISNPQKYFNNPIEFNAFIQQGLTRVENHLSKVSDKAATQNLIGKDANEFYRRVLKVLSPGVKKNLNDKFKNKLKKRVAQMWDHTMEKFNGGKKDD